jgi:hypothetical protein
MLAGRVFLTLSLWAFTALAHTLRGSLDFAGLELTPEIATSTVVQLNDINGKTNIAYLRKDAQFVFENVEPGVYLLELKSIEFPLDKVYHINVDAAGSTTVHEILAGHDKIRDLGPKVEYPIIIKPLLRASYIIPKPGFSVLAMIKSPMMLLSLGSLVMVFVFPKLTESMDPELLKEVQNRQEARAETLDKVANLDMASYMAQRQKQRKQGRRAD